MLRTGAATLVAATGLFAFYALSFGEGSMEAEYRKKSGREGIGLVSAHVIEIDGEPHLFSITRDVTEVVDHLGERRFGFGPLEELDP